MARTKLTKEQEAERLDNMLTNAADANAELEILQNAYDQAPDRRTSLYQEEGSCYDMEDPDDHASRLANTQRFAADMQNPHNDSAKG